MNPTLCRSVSLSLINSFIVDHSSDDVAALALQRNWYSHLSDTDFYFALQQIEGRQLLSDKVPSLPPYWWYPPRLSCEQCSGALTAEYKAELLKRIVSASSRPATLYDLTGGAGIDTHYLSQVVTAAHYVEQNPVLCQLACHNFAGRPVAVHQTTAEHFLSSMSPLSPSTSLPILYMDPARRNANGGKVFRLEDCSPNAVEVLNLLGNLRQECVILLKLSPMLDLSAALYALSGTWETYVLAVKNEVKELLLLSAPAISVPTITAVDLAHPEETFVFTREEEVSAQPLMQSAASVATYLYEPSAALLKAGAYRLVAQRFGLNKLDSNTHLYMADSCIECFPGRCWRILSTRVPKDLTHANVLTRNFGMTSEQLKKKLRLHDGGDSYVIGARMNNKPCLFWAERIK